MLHYTVQCSQPYWLGIRNVVAMEGFSDFKVAARLSMNAGAAFS